MLPLPVIARVESHLNRAPSLAKVTQSKKKR